MSMNIEVKDIPARLRDLRAKGRRYIVMAFFIFLALLYGGIIVRINMLNRQEPTEEAVTEKLQNAKRPRIDQDTINKIKELEDNSVEVQSLFKDARNNPFQE